MVDGYRIRYVRAVASASAQKISLGAVLAVSSANHHEATLTTTYGLYPSQDPTQGPIGRFFNGSTESRVGLKAGLTQDIWTVINPNITPLQGLITKGNAVLSKALTNAMAQPPAQRNKALAQLFQLRDLAISELTQRFVQHPWPATFLLIVSPLVTWLWLGAIIAAIGGLIALWPARPPRRRRIAVGALEGAAAPEPAVRARELV